MDHRQLQPNQCRYFPCRCFTLGSGISCQVYNGLHQPSGNFRVGVQGSHTMPNPQNQFCAAKQINADHARTKYAQIEIDILKSLQHPNIVGLLDVVPFSDGKIALFMERCDGNLDALVKKPENYWGLPAELVLSLVSQYTNGFKYLYSHNVVHRDIKPLNILYNINTIDQSCANNYGRRDEYLFKLADFGVAKKTAEQDILSSLVGTPEFLCPEVLRGRYGPTADLWSAAVMFYYSIAGHLPFIGRNFHRDFQNHLMLLASSRKYDDIAAYCGSSDMSQMIPMDMLKYNQPKDPLTFLLIMNTLSEFMLDLEAISSTLSLPYLNNVFCQIQNSEFSSTLPQYCQLFGRLKNLFERLLRLMLSPALNTNNTVNSSIDSVVPGSPSHSPDKEMFGRYFRYVDAITQQCWFHVFDISTFSISVAHVDRETFQRPDNVLCDAVLKSALKSVGSDRILQTVGSSDTDDVFKGKFVFEGGLFAFRSRFMSGTLTNWRKTLLVCASSPQDAADAQPSNPIRLQFDLLTKELFIRRELDHSRLPKATAQFFERVVHLTRAGIMPAIAAHRCAANHCLVGAQQQIRMANLSDMLSGPFTDHVANAKEMLARLANESDCNRLRAFTTITNCYRRAEALAHQCDVYVSINPATNSRCPHNSSPSHKDLAQLFLAGTSTGRAELNKQRVKIVFDFLGATDVLLKETAKTLATLKEVIGTIRVIEEQLLDFCKAESSSNPQPLPQASFGSSSVSSNVEPSSTPTHGQTVASGDDIQSSLSIMQADPKVKRSLTVLLESLNALNSALSEKGVAKI